MLLRNLQPMHGHVNRTPYLVEKITNNVLFLRTATLTNKEKHVILPRIPRNPGKDDFPISGFKRTQFSVRVCFKKQWISPEVNLSAGLSVLIYITTASSAASFILQNHG